MEPKICVICFRGSNKEASRSSDNIKWLTLSHILSVVPDEEQKQNNNINNNSNPTDCNEDCCLCPICFEIVHQVQELHWRLEEVKEQIRSKVTAIKEKVLETSKVSLEQTEYKKLHRIRRNLLGIFKDDKSQELPNEKEQNEDLTSEEESLTPVTLLEMCSIDEEEIKSYNSMEAEEQNEYFSKILPTLIFQPEVKVPISRVKIEKQSSPPPLKSEKANSPPPPKHQVETVDDDFLPQIISTRSIADRSQGIPDVDVKPMPFKCVDCGIGYMSTLGFLKHRKNVHLEDAPKNYHCFLCNMSFETQRAQFKHEKKDHDWPQVCPYCPHRKFNLMCRLAKHMSEKHEINEEKIHACHLCGKMFAQEISLRRHIRLHMFDKFKPFVCDICDCRWQNQDDLMTHLQKRHNMSLATPPPLLKPKIKQEPNVGWDLKKVKIEKVDMSEDEKNNQSTSKKKRRQKGLHSCTICSKSFARSVFLDSHLKSHKAALNNSAQINEKGDEEKNEAKLPDGSTESSRKLTKRASSALYKLLKRSDGLKSSINSSGEKPSTSPSAASTSVNSSMKEAVVQVLKLVTPANVKSLKRKGHSDQVRTVTSKPRMEMDVRELLTTRFTLPNIPVDCFLVEEDEI